MLVPPRLRGYTVEGLLGRGASGDVWQARIGATGQRVALKAIPVRSDEHVQRAHAEAGLLAALDHANLVRLHALLAADDAMTLVLDLADGGSLADLLAARGRLTPGEVITALAPVGAAVGYLHDEGVVHGDISPGNILFTAAGVPLLADVGVARLTGDDADAAATPAYVDPLVAAGSVPGPQSDVFMLGGVALHALTGAPPWPDLDPDRAVARAAAGDLGDIDARLAAADVPPEMAAVVRRALTVDPQRRGNGAEFALDLRHGGAPVAVELSAGLAPPAAVRGDRPGPRHAAARPGAGARPAFERPTTASAPPDPTPPTRMVAPRARPVIPRPPRRRSRRRVALLLAAVVAAGATALALGLGSHAAPHPPARAPAQAALAAPVSPSPWPSPSRSPSLSPSLSPAPARRASATATARHVDWPAQLDALDALRARAYARRAPELLRRVYLPGALLRADAAQLIADVPAGCRLTGVRSHFAHAAVQRSGRRVVIIVRATLRRSQLRCAGRLRGSAPGRGPATLRVVLVRTAAGSRIAAQRRL